MVSETPSETASRLAREAREAGVTGISELERVRRFGATTVRDGKIVETFGTEGYGGRHFYALVGTGETKSLPPNFVATLTASTDPDVARRQLLEQTGSISSRQIREIREEIARRRGAEETAERRRLEAILQRNAEIARQRQQAIEAQKQRLQQEELEREARKRGITTQRLKEEQQEEFKQQQKVVIAREEITQEAKARGRGFTSKELRQRLSEKTGLSPSKAVEVLERGKATERQIFKKQGVSLSEQRRQERIERAKQIQQDPQNKAVFDVENQVNAFENVAENEIDGSYNQENFFGRSISYLRSFEEGKLKEKQELFNRYKAGENLNFIERAKIQSLINAEERAKLNETEAKQNVASIIDEKFNKFVDLSVSKVETIFPEGQVKEFLFTPRENLSPLRASDILKFGFFAPAMVSTQTALETAIRTGQITPVSETDFFARVQPLDKTTRVDVTSRTSVGGKKVGGFSRQIVSEIDDVTNVGIGTGFTFDPSKPVSSSITFPTGKVTTISKADPFALVGETKRLGQARAVTTLGDDALRLFVKKDIGTGVSSRVSLQSADDISSSILFPSGKITTKVGIQKTDITGIIKPTDLADDLFRFTGTTQKPTLSISKQGITKQIALEDINIRGLIKVLPPRVAKEGTKIMTPASITKTPLSKTFTKQVQKSITQQVGGLTQQSESKILQEIIKPSIAKDISGALPTLATAVKQELIKQTRFVDQTGATRLDAQTRQVFSDLGVLQTRFRTSLDVRQPSATKKRQQTKLLIDEKQITKTLLEEKTKQIVRERQAVKPKIALKTNLKTQLKKTLRTPSFLITPFTPKIPEPDIIIPFGFLRTKPSKKKKKKRVSRRGITEYYIPSFTAKALGIAKEVTPKELLKLSREPFALRPIPIIKRRKNGKRKKKK